MEQEYFFSGYCRTLDAGRTVAVLKEDGKVTEIDCCYKLLDGRDKMAFAFEFNLEEWIKLVVVEIDNLAFGATETHLEADKIVKVELVAILLLHLEHKFVVENHLSTLLGVDVGKCNNGTALTTTSE